MALPKEPRQKMINIMYLVLTAILALNVSSEILNAFKTIDESFKNSNAGLRSRSNTLIEAFMAEQNKDVEALAIVWKPKAQKVVEISDNVCAQIEDLKLNLKKEAGQKIQNGEFKEDDLEASTRLFLNGKEGESKGEKLYDLLTKYKSDLSKIDPIIAKEVLTLPDYLTVPKSENNKAALIAMNPAQKWANTYFHMTPTVAALAILSKFENDIRNSQAKLVERCYAQLRTVLTFPDFAIVANSSSEMVKVGDEVSISAGLGAYNKDSKPVINIGGTTVPLGPDGQAVYKIKTTSPGDFTQRVTITYTDPKDNQLKTLSKDVKYSVGTSSGLAVSFDYTRVFYEGIDNQITINSGGNAKNITISLSGGGASYTKVRDGVFNIICSGGGNSTVLTVNDGVNKPYVQTIKIKPVPDPLVQVGGRSYGTISKATLAGFTGAFTKMTEFIYDGPKDYTQSVASFAVVFSGVGYPTPVGIQNNSPYFNDAVLAQFKNCQSGTSILIGNISVTKPGGGTKQIDKSVSFLIK